MASIVSGFEYDIFISYRHKDNKYDGWVTEFVQNLKKELEATFKEDISIYFDVNPHDGLLETHQVDKSLEGKLKCLVFIPIISQTYCDTKSFAWQHEFCAFNKLAKEDEFGREIRLSGGNVASRILPIRVHDLDAEDKLIIENELGGVLRAVEFIYKEAGVNRPLKSTDDKHDNFNKTDYRNQVNKVANAIKELIVGMQHANDLPNQKSVSKSPIPKLSGMKIKLVAAVIAVLSLLSFGFYYLGGFGNKNAQLARSIAVLPFVDMSASKDQEYFSDGLSEELLNVLAKTEGIQVAGRTSSFSYKGMNKSIKLIGEELGVNYVLEGSVRKAGNTLRITAQLIRSDNGFHLWSETYDRAFTAESIFQIQDEIARNVLHALELKLMSAENSVEKKSLPTNNAEAYTYFLKATQQEVSRLPRDIESAIENYKKAIALDEKFAQAYARLAIAYNLLSGYGNLPAKQAKKLMNENIQKALMLDPTEPNVYLAMGRLQHDEGNYEEAIKAIDHSLKLNPNSSEALLLSFHYFSHSARKDDSTSKQDAKKKLYKALELEPKSPQVKLTLARTYWSEDNPDSALRVLDEIIDEKPEYTPSYQLKSTIYSHSPYGQLDEAFIFLHQALRKEPSNPTLLSGITGLAEDLNLMDYARKQNQKMIRDFSENPDGWYGKYSLDVIEGKNEQAIEAIEKYYQLRDNEEDNKYLIYQYLTPCTALGKPEKVISFAKIHFPELMGDSIVINGDNVSLAFDLFLFYKKMGEQKKAKRLGDAFYNFKDVPKDTAGLRNDTYKKMLYLYGVLSQGKIDPALELYRDRYFVDKLKAHTFSNRKSILEMELSKSPNYKRMTATIDQDINKMRA